MTSVKCMVLRIVLYIYIHRDKVRIDYEPAPTIYLAGCRILAPLPPPPTPLPTSWEVLSSKCSILFIGVGSPHLQQIMLIL